MSRGVSCHGLEKPLEADCKREFVGQKTLALAGGEDVLKHIQEADLQSECIVQQSEFVASLFPEPDSA